MTHPTRETKEQFMERYQATDSRIPEPFTTYHIALPCDCDDGGGPTHWAAVSRTDLGLIKDHLDFHAPPDTPWPEGIPEYTEDWHDQQIAAAGSWIPTTTEPPCG